MAEAQSLEMLFGEDVFEDAVRDDDASLPALDDGELVRIIMGYKREAGDVRLTRDTLSDRGWDAYFSRSVREAIEGQSDDFLPKVALAADQTSAIVNRGLTGYGSWFSVRLEGEDAQQLQRLNGEAIEKLMRKHLEPQQSPMGEELSFPTIVADGVKAALFDALIPMKIHGEYVPSKKLTITTTPFAGEEEGLPGGQEQLILVETPQWRLRMDLVRVKDLFLDPSGSHLYVIEASERDWHEIVADAQGEHPMYDIEVVRQMQQDSRDAERESDIAQDANTPTPTGSPRRKVQLLECWGDIIDSEGRCRYRNIVCTIANDRYVIRKPEINPWWHQRAPYVICSLLRVPHTVWHKALYDDAVDLQLTLNEIYNLIVDGALAASWNARQIDMDLIENAADFTKGIPPGATIMVKPGTPPGTPVMMAIQTGQVPQEGLALFSLVSTEFQSATMAKDIQMGSIPAQRTTATAAELATQQGSLFFESIIFNLEHNFIQPALWMAWLTILQHADDWMQPQMANLIGQERASALAQMSPARRYVEYAEDARFRVYGISSILARQKTYQKILALLQVVGPDPQSPLAQAFYQEYDPKLVIGELFQSLNMDPDLLRLTEEKKMQQMQAKLQQMSQLLGQGGPGGAPGGRTPAEPAPPREPGTAEVMRDAQGMRQNEPMR